MSEDQADYVTDALEMMGAGYVRQIVTEVSGWIPVFDVVASFYNDHMTAFVFGRMWNYCGMSDGVCRASLERLAADLKISRATVIRHVEKLCADGFVVDTTPNRRNKPHEYRDGGKVVMKGSLSVVGVSQSNTSQYHKDTVTVSQRYLIKQDNTNIKQKNLKPSAEKPAKPPTPPEVKLFREVTERYPNKINFEDVVTVIQGVSKRLGRDCSADDLRPFYAAWCAIGWNKLNLAWLAYAERGEFPTAQKSVKQNKNDGADALMAYAQSIGAV